MRFEESFNHEGDRGLFPMMTVVGVLLAVMGLMACYWIVHVLIARL
jgi:hypothetical protein